jgi:site-specific DNA recombinase
MTSDNTPQAVIYCRVSDPKQVTRGSGLGSQETRCRDYARAKGYRVVEVFRDEGTSGSVIDRSGMLSMLAYLKKHRRALTHMVIIDDISRLARGLEAHIQLRTAISAAGGKLESPSIEFGEDSDSMLVENLLASVSQHQRQKNAEQTKNRMQARATNGYWGFSPPIGYRYDRVAGHSGKVLVPRQPLASVIKEALEGFASSRFETQAELQRFLQNNPIFPKNRFGTVHSQKVNQILTQVLYAGHMSVAEWGMYRVPAKHEALITYETFLKIDERLHGRQPVAPDRPDLSDDFPLRGFVNCACCDRPMTAAWARGSKGTRYAYYWCFTKGCTMARKNIRKATLEGDFDRLIDSVRPTQELLFTVHAMLKVLWEQRETRAKEQSSHATRELQAIERKIEQVVARLVETDSRAVISAYEAQLQKLQDQKNLLTEKAASAGRPMKSFDESFRTSFAFLSNPRILWASGRVEHRRKMLRLLFGGRVQYGISEGLRTPQITKLFAALEEFSNDNSRMARPKGFEPLTPRFVVWCSIQLSYGRVLPLSCRADAGGTGQEA